MKFTIISSQSLIPSVILESNLVISPAHFLLNILQLFICSTDSKVFIVLSNGSSQAEGNRWGVMAKSIRFTCLTLIAHARKSCWLALPITAGKTTNTPRKTENKMNTYLYMYINRKLKNVKRTLIK